MRTGLKQPLSDKEQTNNHGHYSSSRQIQSTPSRIFNFNIIRLSTLLCQMVISLQRFTLTCYGTYHFHHACYMASSSDPSRYNYLKSVWARIQITKLFTAQFSPVYRHFLCLRLEHCHEKSLTLKGILNTQ